MLGNRLHPCWLWDNRQHPLVVVLLPGQEPRGAGEVDPGGGPGGGGLWRQDRPGEHQGDALLGGVHQGNLEASTSGFQNRSDLCQRLAGGRTLHSQRFVNTKSSLEIKFQPRNEPEHPCLRDPPRPLTLARAGNLPTWEISEGGGVLYQALLLAALWWGTSSVHRCFF